MNYSLREIAQIVDGKFFVPNKYSTIKIESVVTDSRSYSGGENAIFFALKGPRNNGHDFIAELTSKNIKAFVVSDKNKIDVNAAFLLVENTTNALQKLAAFHRNNINYPIVAITGSNGKTIVKEWLNEILDGEFKIGRSPKSYNSQIGVPLSLLLLNGNYNLGIIEAGISEPGEMQNLERIIRPDVGILTNIGDAHQENFSSKEQKLKEKLLLFKGAKQLIFCADDPLINKIAGKFCQEHSVQQISWSLSGKNATINLQAKKSTGKTTISAISNPKKPGFEIPFDNSSAIENACHCFVALTALNVPNQNILPRFKTLQPVAMRLEIKKGMNNCILVNDFYNSDLTSLNMALSVLHQQAKNGPSKKLAILSDIHQTGLASKELFKKVGQLLSAWKIDELIGIGPEITENKETFALPVKVYPELNSFLEKFNREKFRDSAILIKGARKFTFEKISELLQLKAHQTKLEINLNALVDNLNIFKSILKPETKMMVMVKAFSYGSGDTEIAKVLQHQHIDYLAVAVVDEGVELRNAGIKIPIIVMNPELHSIRQFVDYQLEPNLYSTQLLNDFIEFASQNALNGFPVHLKIDTGMNRLGLKTRKEWQKAADLIKNTNCINIKSIFSHLAASDESAFDAFSQNQFDVFDEAFRFISDTINYKIDRHILNSAGIERFPEKQFEMVRLGIGLYGVSVTGLPLSNISTLKSTISQVKIVQPNETVGYGRKGEIVKESKIAVVPLGYADGLDRKLGNRMGNAVVRGKKVPIIGNICMDMLMLDVSGTTAESGDEVEFFGPRISIEEVAKQAGTIPYEILTGISQRVKRVYLQE